MATSLRARQIECLKRMLNFNENVTKSSLAEPVWKVLVYDRFGQDIISPLLNVKELREHGVTLHLPLHSDRDQIPDVPAIYFVQPTDENIQRICQDFGAGLYEKYYLNFINPISRHRLEDLATAAIQYNHVDMVTKVVDQYLNYISLEDDLFTVKHHNRDDISYHALNSANSKDTDIEHVRDVLVDSIFSLLVTLGTVPIIRCPKGNASEMVAEALDKKLRDNLRDTRNSLFTSDIHAGNFSFQRPVLIILDRNMDLCTPLHHTWTYQALCHDVFDLQLNRVTVAEPTPKQNGAMAAEETSKPQIRKYDLSSTDKFWSEHKGSPFPSVAEAVQKELDDYRNSEEEVKKLKNVMGLEEAEEEAISSMWSDNTSKLTSAVSSLPELLEKKRLVDLHMNIATAMLEHIKARKLDVYFETEEKLMSKSTLDKPILDILRDPEAGTPEDKMRLFIIYYLSTPTVSTAEYDGCMDALQEVGCDTSSMTYIRNYKTFSKAVSSGPIQTGGGQSTYSAMFNRISSIGSQLYMEGVKSLVVGTKNLPITRIVDSIMDNKNSQDTEDYRYFDPKMIRGSDAQAAQKNKTNFQEAIVFMVGGGNYIEYINLLSYAKRQPNSAKKVVYGCSELSSAAQFMKQLTRLGQAT